MQPMTVVLFAWVLANQAGVPVPVAPWLLAAGALASTGGLSFPLVLASAVGAAFSADLLWYGLGRWRGTQALTACVRLLRLPRASVDQVEHVFRTHQRRFVWSARFLPELNPVAAGLAGATRLGLAPFLLHAGGSALVWAGAWAGGGYLLGGVAAESPGWLGVSFTVLIAVAVAAVAMSVLALVGWSLRGQPADAMDARTGHIESLARLRTRLGSPIDSGETATAV